MFLCCRVTFYENLFLTISNPDLIIDYLTDFSPGTVLTGVPTIDQAIYNTKKMTLQWSAAVAELQPTVLKRFSDEASSATAADH